MKATAKGQIQLSEALSPSAQAATVLDDLKTGMLISLSQLCDDDCMALFTKHDVKIAKQNKIIIMGKHEKNGLWSIPILPKPVQQGNATLGLKKTKTNWLTITMRRLAAPPNQHSSEQFIGDISQLSQD